MDFLFIVETWMNAVDLNPIMEVTPADCDFGRKPWSVGLVALPLFLIFIINCHL